MQLVADGLILSASDLVGYLACDHLTSLDVDVANGRRKPSIRHDPELDLIEQRGLEHEQAFLASLGNQKRVVNLSDRSSHPLEAAQERTLAAMRDGADAIYQGTLFDGRWRGHPDFLLKKDKPHGSLGKWSYEVADAKLARHVKAAALLQCCVYSDLLEKLQGVAPAEVHIITGDKISHSYRTANYASYFRSVRKQFEERLASDSGGVTYPDPVDHCRICRWYGDCADRRRADDHLSRVAGMTRAYTKALVAGSLPTLTQLGQSPPASSIIEDIAKPALDRLRNQARLQLQQYANQQVRYELIPPDPKEPNNGLARLPEPTPDDVFLDFESHPWATEDGLEYLIGTVVEQDGAAVYQARWAHDAAEEKRAFEALIDFIEKRRRKNERMHVYHYGAYERSALSRLMGRHATCEDEVDALLRGEVLVDMYAVVRQGVRVSQESYSLKKVEKLYMPKREGPSTEPGFAFVEYERWIQSKDQAALDNIQAYNRDDCLSAWKLRAWLEERRPEAERQFGITLGRFVPEVKVVTDELKASVLAARERAEKLMQGVPADPAERTDEQRARALLARLVEWHRREDKPDWWHHYTLMRHTPPEDLFEEPDALTGLTYVGEAGRPKRSVIHRYQYDPKQEHKFRVGSKTVDPETEEFAGTVTEVDPEGGFIHLSRENTSAVPHPRSLIPQGPIDGKAMREALLHVADFVIDNGMNAPGRYRAVRDLLLRKPPRIRGAKPGEALTKDEDIVKAAREIALNLDETCLAIQGPPGTGKTYTGARMILSLVKAGKRVGIAATAHKAITNLVDALCDAAAEEEHSLAILQGVRDEETGSERPNVRLVKNPEVAKNLGGAAYSVVAGTQWLFSRKDMEDRLDVLFLDEAGQMSLANVVAMGGATKSLVLLGDPNQLPQVTQGFHPEGAKVSALEHVLGEDAIIKPDQGLLLTETRRLHPAVCDYISDAFYEGQLQPHVTTRQQQIAPGSELDGVGIRFLPVAHQGNAARCREEGERVADLVEALLGRHWTNQRGETRPLTVADILIVAPYNAQVGEIARRVRDRTGHDARVGTVDKFQGQEGAVVIFSMATSSPEDAPRNAEFLYSRHRLNVAISRARALAVLICSPDLLRLRCRTPEQMRLANALCRLLEVAAGVHQADVLRRD